MRVSRTLLQALVITAIFAAGWATLAQVQEQGKAKAPASKKKAAGAAGAEADEQTAAKDQKAAKKRAAESKAAAVDEGSTKSRSKSAKSARKAAPAAAEDPNEKAIHASAAAFVKAYNAHDAKAVAQLFAVRAEFIDEDGNLIKGRDEIEKDFAAMFEEFPKCQIEVRVDSVRILTPHIAIEEGTVHGRPVPEKPENISSYVAVHVNVDGQWLIGSVRDVEAQPDARTPHEHLEQLAWMVGDWIDESPDAVVKTKCRWDAGGNFLLHDVELHIAGVANASGSMRIGWDPLSKQIKSWAFEAGGGYSEGLWSNIGDEWMVTVRGVTDDGEVMTATHVFRYIDKDTMTWRSYDRVVGGQAVDDVPEFIIKRHPPAPGS